MTSKLFSESSQDHTATDRTPYTYLVGWTQHDKWYYGVRYAKGCHPTDFWKSYFTSSMYVKKFREEHGEPDVIQIRRVFDSVDSSRKWEHRVLCSINVISESKWINAHNGTSPSIESSLRGARMPNRISQQIQDGTSHQHE